MSRLKDRQQVQTRFEQSFKELNNESDLICAIVVASYLDHSLAAILREHFADDTIAVKLLENGPLQAIVGRARLAYCLGLISKGCLSNVETIAKIRNAFAHGIDAETFQSPQIKKHCFDLIVPGGPRIMIPDDGTPNPHDDGLANNPRYRFTVVAALLCTTVTAPFIDVSKCQVVTDYWGS